MKHDRFTHRLYVCQECNSKYITTWPPAHDVIIRYEWSDGCKDGFLPTNSEINYPEFCPDCCKRYDYDPFDENKQPEEVDLFDDNKINELMKIERYPVLYFSDYISAAIKNPNDQELVLRWREHAWQICNNRNRELTNDEEYLTRDDLLIDNSVSESAYAANVLELIEIYQSMSERNFWIETELHRNIGEFEKAYSLIDFLHILKNRRAYYLHFKEKQMYYIQNFKRDTFLMSQVQEG